MTAARSACLQSLLAASAGTTAAILPGVERSCFCYTGLDDIKTRFILAMRSVFGKDTETSAHAKRSTRNAACVVILIVCFYAVHFVSHLGVTL